MLFWTAAKAVHYGACFIRNMTCSHKKSPLAGRTVPICSQKKESGTVKMISKPVQ